MDLSVLSTHSRLRGIGRYVRDLGLALDALGPAQRGFELRALTDVGGMWSPAVTAAGVTAAISAFDAAALARPHRPWAQRMRARLPRASRTFDHGLLHLGNPDATPRRALALPTVPTCHDLIPLRYPKEYLRRIWDGFEVRRRFEAQRYRAAAHVLAVSRVAADDLVRFLELPADRITVVYNGIDLERWSSPPGPQDEAVLDKHGLRDAPFALYVGAGDWRKNAHRMLQALVHARRQPGASDLRLVWAGHLSREHVRNLGLWVEELGLEGAVHHLDYVPDEDLESLYRQARLTVLVSLAEGFGYPIVEAMAAGCPVVTSQGTSTEEISGDAAIIVDPLDVDAIGEALAVLTRDDPERARLGARGRQQAQRFRREVMAETTAAVFRQILR